MLDIGNGIPLGMSNELSVMLHPSANTLTSCFYDMVKVMVTAFLVLQKFPGLIFSFV
jgi:hypothetical protein